MGRKKLVFMFLALSLAVCMTGCGRKQETLEEVQEPMSIEDLSRINSAAQTAPQAMPQIKPQAGPQAIQGQVPVVLEPALPPTGSYKPTAEEIQTALRNANYYTGPIDGKIGPLSKKAIEEFQKANNLQADAKVGLKTWEVLGKYLNPEPVALEPVPAKKKR